MRGDGPIFKVRRWWRQFYSNQQDGDHDINGEKKGDVRKEQEKSKIVVEQSTIKNGQELQDKVPNVNIGRDASNEDSGNSMEW